jgi:hypothetical protein
MKRSFNREVAQQNRRKTYNITCPPRNHKSNRAEDKERNWSNLKLRNTPRSFTQVLRTTRWLMTRRSSQRAGRSIIRKPGRCVSHARFPYYIFSLMGCDAKVANHSASLRIPLRHEGPNEFIFARPLDHAPIRINLSDYDVCFSPFSLQKHYYFNSKTGKQTWEFPAAEGGQAQVSA